MGVSQKTNIAGNGGTTDAAFRTWAKTIHDALIEAGAVQTAHAGQINLDTVIKPTVASTYAGYEIFRFDDALQATAPVFIRIAYGTATSSANNFSLTVWVTRGPNAVTDAANITPDNYGVQLFSTTFSAHTTPEYILASCGPDRFAIFTTRVDDANADHTHGFSVERTKDIEGTNTDDAVALIFKRNSRPYMMCVIMPRSGPFSTPNIASDSTNSAIFWQKVVTGQANLPTQKDLRIAFFPTVIPCGSLFWGYHIAYMRNDVPAHALVDIEQFGETRTFRMFGPNGGRTDSGGDLAMALYWE